jgi:aspartyl-tRNA synthetase
MIRTHDAGGLRVADADMPVILAGWVARRRDHGGVTFLDLRDSSGVVQVVCRDLPDVHELRSEWCVAVIGRPARRRQHQPQPRHR